MRREITKKYLQKHYWDNGKSVRIIAEELHTYPNNVRRRILEEYGKLRSKSEAQANALKRGTHKHPTKGKERSNEEKLKISQGVSLDWERSSVTDREKRSDKAKKNWEKKSFEERRDMTAKAMEAVRRTAKEGSSLEKFLLDELKDAGYNVLFHVEAIEGTSKMQVDLLVSDANTVVEIDGPSHFSPIFGQEALQQRINWDNEKNRILQASGYNVIRVRININTISLRVKTETRDRLLLLLDRLKTGGINKELIRIEVN